jgi:hypothetical protein
MNIFMDIFKGKMLKKRIIKFWRNNYWRRREKMTRMASNVDWVIFIGQLIRRKTQGESEEFTT